MDRPAAGSDQTEALVNRADSTGGAYILSSGEWIAGKPAREVVAGLLEVGEAVPVPAIPRFAAGEMFVVNRDSDVPFSLIGDDFAANFLGLVETDVPAATLRQLTLVKGSTDAPIFAALGGEAAARIPLAHAFAFLKVADRSRWFFFYVAGVDGALWALDTYWRDGGWDIEVYSVTYPRGWRGGGCVVSR